MLRGKDIRLTQQRVTHVKSAGAREVSKLLLGDTTAHRLGYPGEVIWQHPTPPSNNHKAVAVGLSAHEDGVVFAATLSDGVSRRCRILFLLSRTS